MTLALMIAQGCFNVPRPKSDAEDAWLLLRNRGTINDPVLYKVMFKGIEVYKGRSLADKIAVMPSQVRGNI